MPLLVSGESLVVYTSTGRPTVELRVTTAAGCVGRAALPLGCPSARHDPKRVGKRSVQPAVESLRAGLLTNWELDNQWEFDERVKEATESLEDPLLCSGVRYLFSAASARAAAADRGIPFHEYIADVAGFDAYRGMPVPVITVLNGGCAATSPFKVQAIMIAPVGAPSLPDAIRAGSEIAEACSAVLKSQGKSYAIGDEGGLSTSFDGSTSKDRLSSALEAVALAIEKAGYRPGGDTQIAIDFAAGRSLVDGDRYALVAEDEALTASEVVDLCATVAEKFPVLFFEDPLAGAAHHELEDLKKRLRQRSMIAADDILEDASANLDEHNPWSAVIVRPDRLGTLSDTTAFVAKARHADRIPIASHRSSETEDVLLADLAAALSLPFMKAGGLSGAERTAKYNELVRISELYQPGQPVLDGCLGPR